MVVEWFTKYEYFCEIQITYTTSQVENLFTNKIHIIHGSPKVIISDRDPKFIGNSSKELWKLRGTTLVMK